MEGDYIKYLERNIRKNKIIYYCLVAYCCLSVVSILFLLLMGFIYLK